MWQYVFIVTMWLIVLKIWGVLNLSWWLVLLLPLMVSAAFDVFVLASALLYSLGTVALSKVRRQ